MGGYLWRMSCLRPAPPTRAYINQEGKKAIIKREPETSYEEDMQILRVIEAYCSLTSTSKQRHTFSTSTMLDNMPVLLADEEKLTSSPMEQSTSSNDDRSMATDNYNLLKEEITQQKEQIRSLYNRLEDEICSRKRLESII